MAREFRTRGWKVFILASDADLTKKKRLPSTELIDGIEVIRFRRFIPYFRMFVFFGFFFDSVSIYLQSKKIKEKHTLDLIISRHYRVVPSLTKVFNATRHYYLVPGVAKYQQQVKVSRGFRGFVLKKYSNRILLPLKICFQRKSLMSTTTLVFSEQMRKQLHSGFRKYFDQIHKVYPGVDTDRFQMIIPKPINPFTFIMVCRLIEHKGIEKAIEACSLLSSYSFKLIIVGDGPLLDYLKGLCTQLDVNHMVEFLGFSMTPEVFYKKSHCFLMTSVHESFGQTIIEAYSCGLPVIAFRSKQGLVDTASSEIVRDGINGYLCAYTTESLAKKMMKCMELPEKDYLQIGLNNRNEAEIKYNWGKLIDKLITEDY